MTIKKLEVTIEGSILDYHNRPHLTEAVVNPKVTYHFWTCPACGKVGTNFRNPEQARKTLDRHLRGSPHLRAENAFLKHELMALKHNLKRPLIPPPGQETGSEKWP
jgi:hypothetical protein